MTTPQPASRRRAFTLVELLVVIAIIGVLAALLIPTVYYAMVRAKNARIAMEITTLDKAIESYKAKYGDYPPDFSDRAVLERHLNKVFPRMLPAQRSSFLSLAYPYSDPNQSRIDPAEALVFFLGGFSDNPQQPFTGTGGPLVVVGTTYYYNAERNVGLFTFDQGRLTLYMSGTNLFSNDESVLHGQATSEHDSFPVYKPQGLETPYVYFDSRAYMQSYPGGDPTATTPPAASAIYQIYPPVPYLSTTSVAGIARPYRSDTPRPSTTSDPFGFRWQNEKTFQILCAGLDEDYGEWEGPASYHKRYPSGENFSADRGDHDNIANFSNGALEDAQP